MFFVFAEVLGRFAGIVCYLKKEFVIYVPLVKELIIWGQVIVDFTKD